MKSPAIDIDDELGRKARTARSDAVRLFFQKYATVVGLVLLLLLFFATKPTVFLTVANVRNILVAVAVLGVIAVGQTVVFSTFDFDMSVGSIAEMTAVICTSIMVNQHVPWALALLIALVVGCACGAINGFLVAYVNLNPFIVTMGTLTLFQGLGYYYTSAANVTGFSNGFLQIGQGSIGPVPYLVIILVVVAVIAYFVMERTTVGRRWYAVGGSYEASYLAGLRNRRLRLLAFVVCGACAALGGMMLASRLAEAGGSMADGQTLQSIAAVFLGFTAFKEGFPNIAGTMVGVLFLGVMINGMAINTVNSYLQLVVTGFVVIGSVALAGLMKKGRS